MASLTNEEVAHVAKLSNLKLNKGEIAKFRRQLASVIGFVKKLQEVNTENVEPTSQTTGLVNVMRKDGVCPSFKIDDVFYSTNQRLNNFFVIERLLKERGKK